MKNINKKYKNIDPLADIKKKPNFQEQYRKEGKRINLAIEVSNMRKKLNLSQQELARRAGTTQKIISEIERADYNIGFDLYDRLIEALNLGSVMYKIHEYGMPLLMMPTYKIKVDKTKSKSSDKKVNNYQIKTGQEKYILNS